jgi:hypothetical protein
MPGKASPDSAEPRGVEGEDYEHNYRDIKKSVYGAGYQTQG